MLELEAFSYDERRNVLPGVVEALEACGCWVLEKRTVSVTDVLLRVEMLLRDSVGLYSSLMASGLEMTRSSHLGLTELCTLRSWKRGSGEPFRIVELWLKVSFLDELNLASALMPGAGEA